MAITGHVDSSYFLEEQMKGENEKKAPKKLKGKQGKKKKLDDTIHDEYRVEEDTQKSSRRHVRPPGPVMSRSLS